MAGEIDKQVKRELLTLARTAGIKRRIKVDLFDWYDFEHPCQGQIPLAYSVKGVEYEGNDPSFLAEYHELPEAVVTLSQAGLGTAIHDFPDARRKEQIAEEMTDPLCQKAGCNNGADCVLRRLKNH